MTLLFLIRTGVGAKVLVRATSAAEALRISWAEYPHGRHEVDQEIPLKGPAEVVRVLACAGIGTDPA
jgi:hypothetical protein